MGRVFVAIFIAALMGGSFALAVDGRVGLINFSVGFLTALVVLAASMFGYWQLVSSGAADDSHTSWPDPVESIDDRFSLWEDSPEDEKMDVKTILAEEKVRLKKRRRSWTEWLKTAKPAISIYRIVAYLLLIGALISLIKSGLFDPVAFLLGVGAAPMAVALGLWFSR